MSNFFVGYYLGENSKVPEDESKQMAEFQAWLGGLGEAVVNPGRPLSSTRTIDSDSAFAEVTGM